MSELTESVPFTVGIRATGAGTLEDRCLCVAWPLRLRFEVEEGKSRDVSIFYGDRRITRWKLSPELLDSGRLAEALSWPVTVAFEGYLEVGHVGGKFYLITDCEEDPEWIDIGPHIRFEEHYRFPGQPVREIADVLLQRLYGKPETEVERLLSSIGGQETPTIREERR
jgi:hypothetical protein